MIGIPTAIISAIAGAFALSEKSSLITIAGILAIIAAVLVAVTTFLNPNEKAHSHHEAGNRFNKLRNNVRIFIEIDALQETSIDLLSNQLKGSTSRRDDLNLNSRHIPRWAYEKAKMNIERGETDYVVDEMKDV